MAEKAENEFRVISEDRIVEIANEIFKKGLGNWRDGVTPKTLVESLTKDYEKKGYVIQKSLDFSGLGK